MTNDEAYEKGYKAYWKGADASDNPYAKGTDDHRSWEAGWRAAQQQAHDESED